MGSLGFNEQLSVISSSLQFIPMNEYLEINPIQNNEAFTAEGAGRNDLKYYTMKYWGYLVLFIPNYVMRLSSCDNLHSMKCMQYEFYIQLPVKQEDTFAYNRKDILETYSSPA